MTKSVINMRATAPAAAIVSLHGTAKRAVNLRRVPAQKRSAVGPSPSSQGKPLEVPNLIWVVESCTDLAQIAKIGEG